VLFDVFLEDALIAPAGALMSVKVNCPTCLKLSTARIWNHRENLLTCPQCRWSTRQFTHACSATVDPLTNRIGRVAARQYRVDWRAYGPMGLCLGPAAERRVMLCLQFNVCGLPRRPIAMTASARRVDTGRQVAVWQEAWLPCSCSDGECKHNRLVHWLPPTDIWDQTALDCDVRLQTERGELLFEERLRFDIEPPTLGTTGGEAGAEEQPPASAKDGPTTPELSNVVDRFHHLYYYGEPGEHQVWVRTFWMNVPCIQCPLDLWIYQEIISELRPDLVIETGTLLGGTSLFLAQSLDAIGKGKVISIDLEDLPRPAHPRIEYVAGSSTDAELIGRLFADRPTEETRLVILDSDHAKAHVLAEMRLFAPFVGLGSYLIVTDSNTNGHPVFSDYGPGPYEAVEQFLSECDEFQVDSVREKHKLTFNPRGYLKRVKPPSDPAERAK
jgi:cephalosporin hydroxylase